MEKKRVQNVPICMRNICYGGTAGWREHEWAKKKTHAQITGSRLRRKKFRAKMKIVDTRGGGGRALYTFFFVVTICVSTFFPPFFFFFCPLWLVQNARKMNVKAENFSGVRFSWQTEVEISEFPAFFLLFFLLFSAGWPFKRPHLTCE